MAKGDVLEGVFAINKPLGMSSAQVIRDCQSHFQHSATFKPLLEQDRANRANESWSEKRRRSKAKQGIRVKMGHGGTLDPLATGVLILGVGKGTKALPRFLGCTKTYETVVLFGASTDTYDRVGRLIKKGPYGEITRPAVEKAMESFRGKYRQMPPLYSALKMEGKPLYEYAREGKPIPREIETREVDVSELELVEWYDPGTHDHRWPTDEADLTEKNLVDSVWRVAKRQAASDEEPRVFTPEQEEQESQALAQYQTTKRAAEESFDSLVHEDLKSPKRRKVEEIEQAEEPMMSGALGKLPRKFKGKGSDLIPTPPAPNTPPPWEGKGPPAAKIRMTVTSGFYVRSFCHDLGEKLGSGAMMAELCRTRQGQFSLDGERCMEYDDLDKGEDVWGPQIDSMLGAWSKENGGSTHRPNPPARVQSSPGTQQPEGTEEKPDSKTSQGDSAQAEASLVGA
ncbi:pseudouridine synthase [Thozetella sp. PMI_491]|nr:pseudouridine synthase [Thozetella sp. PMI_491]